MNSKTSTLTSHLKKQFENWNFKKILRNQNQNSTLEWQFSSHDVYIEKKFQNQIELTNGKELIVLLARLVFGKLKGSNIHGKNGKKFLHTEQLLYSSKQNPSSYSNGWCLTTSYICINHSFILILIYVFI